MHDNNNIIIIIIVIIIIISSSINIVSSGACMDVHAAQQHSK
jgi:hypothetical protein